jgi:hypothetical protein
MTRAFAALAHGEWRNAMRLQPLSPLLAVEAALIWAGWPLVRLGWLRRPSPAEINAWCFIHFALLVAVWVWRWIDGALPA